MDTFCGCDTAALDDLSSMVGERAAHLGAVMEGVAQVVATTDWFGPDEQGFQEQLDEVYEGPRAVRAAPGARRAAAGGVGRAERLLTARRSERHVEGRSAGSAHRAAARGRGARSRTARSGRALHDGGSDRLRRPVAAPAGSRGAGAVDRGPAAAQRSAPPRAPAAAPPRGRGVRAG